MSDHRDEIKVVNEIMSMLSTLDEDSRMKVLHTVSTFFGFDHVTSNQDNRISPPRDFTHSSSLNPAAVPYSENILPSPKEFLREKGPQSDVERLACLAYYLTHYRDTPEFKTLDLSKLNTEAAQQKFSNPSKSAGNALQYGYLAPANKGFRQISASGEDFVNALPNREIAKDLMLRSRPKWKKSGRSQVKSKAQ